MLSHRITVCIFAFNEELRILRCIRNFDRFFKVIVINNFSTDRTKEIVEAIDVPVVSIKNPGYIETSSVMDLVLSAIDTDYVLIASVSEFVPLKLMNKYAEVANSRSYDVVRAYRKSITAGQAIPISGTNRSGRHSDLRFFRKGCVCYANTKIHDRGVELVPSERILNLAREPDLFFYQFRDYDCSRTELTLCRYDDVLGIQKYDQGYRFSFLKALLHAAKAFFITYILYGSYKYKMLGFIHCYYRAHMEFTTWLRVWEHQSGHSLLQVKQLNEKIRARLEAQL
jgi:glycosyltransferase involved in cell wall biosynthesis